jgi:Icc protein
MRIAHVSDVHLLHPHRAAASLSARLVSYARAFDPVARKARLERALALAVARGADHVVVSGDLTEIGAPAQFEAFGEALANAGLRGDQVTLVPGNHDAYGAASA